MNKYQQTFVEAVLHQAFVDGKQFDDIDQVEAFFKENGVHADFHSHSRDIFNIFLRVKARSRQTLTPDGSHLESAAGTDCGPDVSPAFTDEDPFTISLYVPRYDGFRVASARRCRGKECFISKVTVELYNLEVRNQRTLLKWHRTGRSLVPFSQTWYQVAEPEIVDGCEVAIGEDCATQDREHSESEADSEDAVTDELVASRSGDVVRGIGANGPLPLSPIAEQADFEQTLARLNMYSAIELANAKRKVETPGYGQASSSGSKRARTSSHGSSAPGSSGNFAR